MDVLDIGEEELGLDLRTNEEFKALGFIKQALLRKNEKILELARKLDSIESENQKLKVYQWRCITQEKEIECLRDELRLYGKENEKDNEFGSGEEMGVHSEDQNQLANLKKSFNLASNSQAQQYFADNFDDDDEYYAETKAMLNSKIATTSGMALFSENKNNGTGITSHDSQHQSEKFPRQQQCFEGGEYLHSLPDETSVIDKTEPKPSSSSSQKQDSSPLPSSANLSPPTSSSLQQDQNSSEMNASQLASMSSQMFSWKNTSRQCPVCHKVCHSRSAVSIHMRTHTGEKPYHCPHCEYRCSVKWNLTKHIQYKHQVGERPFKCQLCEKTFVTKRELRSHSLVRHGTFQDPAATATAMM